MQMIESDKRYGSQNRRLQRRATAGRRGGRREAECHIDRFGIRLVAGMILFLTVVLPGRAAAVAVGREDTTAVAVEADSLPKAERPVSISDLPLDTLWTQAHAAYSDGRYRQAAELYETLLERGMHSPKLYYNLGNCWFKQGRMGRAILNYNRALLLDPTDEDAQYNLALANVRIVDRIDTVPEFFLKTWLRELGLSLGSDAWAVLGLVFLGLTFGAVLLWLLGRTLPMRQAGFYGGLAGAVLCIACTCYAHFQRTRLLHGDEAVVMNLMAPVKSSPGAGSKDIFVLHEGTKVRMLDRLDGWTEIVLADGNKGWIASNAIEPVVLRREGETNRLTEEDR